MPRKYSSQQMEEILRRAMQREAAGEISHDELLEAAKEVGIDPADIEAAAHELEHERGAREREQRVRTDLRRRALGSFGNYLVINAVCFAANAFTGPGQWFPWVLLGTTALLVRRMFVSFFPNERQLERAESRLKKREERALKRRDRAEWERQRKARQKETAEHFERAVEESVQALMKVAANKLEQYNRASEPPRTRMRVETPPTSDRDEVEDAEIVREEPHRRRPR